MILPKWFSGRLASLMSEPPVVSIIVVTLGKSNVVYLNPMIRFQTRSQERETECAEESKIQSVGMTIKGGA
jgi:hypothetical protein